MYNGSVLFPMFNLQFEETLVCPASGDFYTTKEGEEDPVAAKRIVRYDADSDSFEYATIFEDTPLGDSSGDTVCIASEGGYVADSRTGQPGSYIPDLKTWNISNLVYEGHDDWTELKVHHILVLGKDALTRTGLAGQDQAKMYVKAKGSAGVLDPIDQRQSIGFKINSVGFGSTRPEAIADYMCVPSTANLVG
jgi:hypothetical protein